MSLSPKAIITDPEEVWVYLDAGDTDRTRFSTLMEGWINSVSIWLENQCSRVIVPQTFTRYQDGNGRRILYAEEYPILSLDRVRIFDSDLDDFDEIAVNPASRELTFDNDTGRLMLLPDADRGSWTRGIRNIELTYRAGFEQHEIDVFKDAVRELIAQRWMAMGRDPMQQTRSDNINTSVSFSSANFNELPPITQQVIMTHRRREV